MHFLLALFCSAVFLPHDIDIASFNFIQEENLLRLQIHLDREDVENLFQQHLPEKSLSDSSLTAFLEDYLRRNMTLIVDDEKVNFVSFSFERDPQFYHFQLQSTTEQSLLIHKIQLENTCFINEFEDYNNLMNFDVNEVYRTFRMHKERQRISFEYGEK